MTPQEQMVVSQKIKILRAKIPKYNAMANKILVLFENAPSLTRFDIRSKLYKFSVTEINRNLSYLFHKNFITEDTDGNITLTKTDI